MEGVKRRNPHQPEFVQAVQEVAEDIFDFIEDKEAYHSEQILRRIAEPDRVVSFRVCWEDDNGNVRVQRGYRIQNNNAIGPYKGGIRFHPSVNESVLKFLAFEQTFKNALTGLPMGGGKGGANFNPKGKCEREIMRFCQSFMTELYRHIGADVDVPAGDIGVGGREIGYMFGQYKRITNQFTGVLTGKGLEYGGSMIRPEATGYGAVYFLDNMLKHKGRDLAGLTRGGLGLGQRRDARGREADPARRDADHAVGFGRLHPRSRRADAGEGAVGQGRTRPTAAAGSANMPTTSPARPSTPARRRGTCRATWRCPARRRTSCSGRTPRRWSPTAASRSAKAPTCPRTSTAVHVFKAAKILFAPGKAANAGGVAVSGLEMSQNSERRCVEGRRAAGHAARHHGRHPRRAASPTARSPTATSTTCAAPISPGSRKSPTRCWRSGSSDLAAC